MYCPDNGATVAHKQQNELTGREGRERERKRERERGRKQGNLQVRGFH